MSDPRLLESLTAHHAETVSLAERTDDSDLRAQYHTSLSPLGWHIGHCAFMETRWVQYELLGDPGPLRRWEALYQPEAAYKPERGARLPGRSDLIEWSLARHAENVAVLADPPRRARGHPLLRDDYLPLFLLQHYAQHLETIDYVLAQQALHSGVEAPAPSAAATPTGESWATLGAGTYRVGCDDVRAYDNEQPAHAVTLSGARISRSVVTNEAYRAFVADGGYRRRALWDEAGWAWRCRHAVAGPWTWRRDAGGAEWQISPRGWVPYRPGDAVTGLSHFEAEAFARWAGARLPHEHEWEAARASGMLTDVGRVWEWCRNPFHPYPGFRAFPYRGYSVPWFDEKHFVMRGASASTRAAVRRRSFRNFYTRDVRHVFAGLRLALDL